ncbi:MAG TPA: hypothetical protein VG738_14375 [Chitinophagaceae bacterium]|nr:hypothetical protein [Chitinophagaceae bacterium]
MLRVLSIGRALLWLFFGTIFGLASLLLVFASAAIFTHHINGKIIDDYVIVFLCIALMSGAGSDYLLSVNHHMGWRSFAFSLIIIALVISFYLFNPNNRITADAGILNGFTYGYVGFTSIYCIGLKGVIFYQESVNKHNSKNN